MQLGGETQRWQSSGHQRLLHEHALQVHCPGSSIYYYEARNVRERAEQ